MDSGSDTDNTARFVLASRVNSPDNICSNRLPDPSAEFPAAPPRAIDSMNLTPASNKPAAAVPMLSAAAGCSAPADVAFSGTGATGSITGFGSAG